MSEAGYIFLFLVSVYKVPFNIGECIYLVSLWGYKKYIPYFMSVQQMHALTSATRGQDSPNPAPLFKQRLGSSSLEGKKGILFGFRTLNPQPQTLNPKP